MIKITIADNQPAVVRGLMCYFRNNTSISVSDTVYHLKDIDDSLKNIKVNILLIDLELDGVHTINYLKKISTDHPDTKLLIYTSASEKLFGAASFKAGISGFISKNESLENVELALLKVAQGKSMYSDQVRKYISPSEQSIQNGKKHKKLSTRESEVLYYLVNGKKNNEISELLNVNEKTVSTYKLRLLNKLNATNVSDLISKAKTLQII